MPYHTTHGEGCGLLHQGCPPAVLSFPLGRYCEGHLPYAWARLNCHLVSRFCNLRGFPCLSVLRPDCLSIVQSSHIQPLYASASRKQQAERAWSLSVSATSAPVHSIAGNLPWEPSDFHMKRKGLAASCGESIRADWTGRALARPCGPDRRGQLGQSPVPGLRTAIRTAGSSRTDREARRLRCGWG